MHKFARVTILGLWGVLELSLGPQAFAAAKVADAVNFSRDIRPILSDNCYHCHGPDEKARKAKLRLDRKEGAFRIQDDVAVIVPGNSKKSELIRRITNTDPDE